MKHLSPNQPTNQPICSSQEAGSSKLGFREACADPEAKTNQPV